MSGSSLELGGTDLTECGVRRAAPTAPFRVHVMQTTRSRVQCRFHWHLETLDIRYVYIRPRTPRLNGKVERSHRIDGQEFDQLLDKGDIRHDIHLFNEKLHLRTLHDLIGDAARI